MYLLAVLGFCCCAGFSPAVMSRGSSLVVVCGLLPVVVFLMSVFYKCFDCHFFFESIFWLLLLMKVNSLQGLSSVLEDIHMSLWVVGCLSPVQCIITAHYPTGNHFDTMLKSKGQFICEDIALSQFLPSWFWHYL